GLYRHIESTYPKLLPAIAKEKALSDEMIKQLQTAVVEFRRQSDYGKDGEAAPASEPPATAKPEAAAKPESPPKPESAPKPAARKAAAKPEAAPKPAGRKAAAKPKKRTAA
ncbi:MAG: hypothetical protein ABIQ05_00905, partial [Candidatus Limnocylindria bacterium]